MEDDEEDDDEEEELPDEAGRVYDTSERSGRYEPIRTDPENGVLRIHPDGEIPQGQVCSCIKGTPQPLSDMVQKPQDFPVPHHKTIEARE